MAPLKDRVDVHLAAAFQAGLSQMGNDGAAKVGARMDLGLPQSQSQCGGNPIQGIGSGHEFSS
jgi:hypothetical protein